MLLKEDDTAGDIFQCTLGNLPPKTDAKISFSYVIELPQEPDGKIRFTLPTVLNPRYSPGNIFYLNKHYVGRVMRKPVFALLCKNKVADQLRGNSLTVQLISTFFAT